MQAKGVSVETLRFGYVAGAARLLGERWERDQTSFFDVTVATGHLYAVMRAIGPALRPVRSSLRPQRRALFAVVPGEKHTLGISLAAETFRDDGWGIALRLSDDHDSLVQYAEQDRPVVIGLSFSTAACLPDLIRLVLALRIVVPSALIGIAPPPDVSEDELLGVVDIDLVFRHAQQAVADMDRLMQLRH